MRAPASQPVIVGLDVGTTGVKAAAFGLGSAWRTVALREYPLLEPAPGQAVQDPAAILTASAEALAECVGATAGAEVVAVSVSAGMHGLLALDHERRPLTPLITWADARARDEARELRRSGTGDGLHALTGVPVHPMTPLTKLMWFAREAPGVWEAARWWIGLKDWILLWLSGTLVTELSSASGTGLLDMSTRTWSDQALAASGVDPDRLPPILATTARLPMAASTARAAGLPPGTPVVAGAGDGPLANLGVGAISAGVAGLSLGTSGAVRTAVAVPQVDSRRTLFCYALTESLWVVGGAISNGGEVLRWAGTSLAPDVVAAAGARGADDALLAMAASVPAGSEGLVMLPYLLAERAPLWDPDLPGAYLGLRHEHTRAHLVRAGLEGVGLQMRMIFDRLNEVRPISTVRATGGVFRSPLWRQVMAAMLERPIEVVGDADGTALGAAALGLLALGRAPDLAAAVRQLSEGGPPPQTVNPDPGLVAVYDRLRRSVPALVESLRSVSALVAAPAGPELPAAPAG